MKQSFSELGNEITTLKSDFKKSQDLEEKMNCNISQLGNELITLKSELKNIVSSLTAINTSLAARLKKVDQPPITQDPSFPPKDNIKDKDLSIDKCSHSVVKSELETSHTEKKV